MQHPTTSQYHNTCEEKTLNHIISTQKYNLEHLCTAKRLQALLNFMPANKSQTVFGVSTNMLCRLTKISSSCKQQNTKWLSTYKCSLRLFVCVCVIRMNKV